MPVNVVWLWRRELKLLLNGIPSWFPAHPPDFCWTAPSPHQTRFPCPLPPASASLPCTCDSQSPTRRPVHISLCSTCQCSSRAAFFFKVSHCLVLQTVTTVTYEIKPRCHRRGFTSSSPIRAQPSGSSLKLNYQLEH